MASLETCVHSLALSPEELLAICRRERFQASGAGGQKRNRVYSAVRLSHEQTGLTVTASEYREAERNLRGALHKLRIALALCPSWEELEEYAARLSPENRMGSDTPAGVLWGPLPRARIQPAHPDFPLALLRVRLRLAATGGELKPAAEGLGMGSTEMVRLVAAQKQSWQSFQEFRRAKGLGLLQAPR